MYPNIPPATEAIEQYAANNSDFLRAPMARAISNISGGTIKNDDSEKATITKTTGPAGLSAHLSTQS